MGFCGIYLRPISQEVLKMSIWKMHSKKTLVKLHISWEVIVYYVLLYIILTDWIGWGNGFMASGNKRLSELMLVKICNAIWCHQATVSWYPLWDTLHVISPMMPYAWLIFFQVMALIIGNVLCHSTEDNTVYQQKCFKYQSVKYGWKLHIWNRWVSARKT